MTSEEVVILTRYVKSMCPQQHMDKYTPDAWEDALLDLEMFECRRAVTEICKRKPFVAPAEIRAEVARIREDRLSRALPPAPPADIADDPGRYQQAIRDQVRRIADGHSVQRAIGRGPCSGEPPEFWKQARAALGPAGHKPRPQDLARDQLAQSRRERGADIRDNWDSRDSEPS